MGGGGGRAFTRWYFRPPLTYMNPGVKTYSEVKSIGCVLIYFFWKLGKREVMLLPDAGATYHHSLFTPPTLPAPRLGKADDTKGTGSKRLMEIPPRKKTEYVTKRRPAIGSHHAAIIFFFRLSSPENS